MIKRTLLTLALALAGSSWAALAPLPSDTKYDSVVTLRTGSSADDLNAVLQALGASVGLTVITQDIPAKAVNFDISGKPFREVWTLLLELNGLDYQLRPSNIIVVAPPKILDGTVRPPAAVSNTPTGPDPVRQVYIVYGDAVGLVTYLRAELPKAAINSVGKTITITAVPAEQDVAKQLLAKVDPAPNAPQDVQKPTAIPVSREFYTVNGKASDLATLLTKELPGSSATFNGQVISFVGTDAQQEEVARILEAVDPAPMPIEPIVVQIPTVIPVTREFYTVNGKTSDLAALLTKELLGSSATFNGQIISFVGTDAQQTEAARILEEVDPAPNAPSIATERRIVEIKSDPKMLIATLNQQVPGLKVEVVADKGLSLVGTPLQLSDALGILKVIDVPPVVVAPPVMTERRIVEIKADPKTLIATLTQQVPGLKVESVADKGLSLVGTPLQISDAVSILKVIDVPAPSVVVVPPVITERRIVEIKTDAKALISVLNQQVIGLKVESVADKGLSLVGTPLQLADAERILKIIDIASPVIVVVPPALVRGRNFFDIVGSAVDEAAVLTKQIPGLQVDFAGKDASVLAVTGTISQLEDAARILKQIDRPLPKVVQAAIIQKVFTLVNSKAEEVKGVLEGTLKRDITLSDGEISKTGLLQPGGSTFSVTNATTNDGKTVGAVTQGNGQGLAVTTDVGATVVTAPVQILVDGRTNSLIVRGTQGQIDQIDKLLPTLDKKVPLINIQVRIQEVTESGATSLGLDWTAGIGNFVTKIVGGNLTGLFDATRSLAGFNIGATLNASEKQGTSKRVDDASVIMESGQAKIARLRSGGKLRVNLIGGAGIIKETFDYGVIIDVGNTRIDADGTIHLDVNAKVESLLTPPTDPTLINTSNREAQTTLALKTGQTALLGGLLSTQNKTSTTGIPFLSSLPLIGPLFSKTDNTSEKTQLLLVLTATAVD